MAKNTKALIFIAFGAFAAIIGSAILCAGGFKSVMINPNDGPALASNGSQANARHFQQLILNYPELFNCKTLNEDFYANANVATAADYAPYFIANEDVRDSARAYCRYHDGEQAWTFALYLPMTLLMLAIAVTALIRQSGFTLGLVGVGLSATMLAFTIVIIAHYQAHSFVPQALDAFTECDGLTSASIEETMGYTGTGLTFTSTAAPANLGVSAFDGSLTGPNPRRGWICNEMWDYDSDLKTASRLVYGGAAVSIVAYLALLIAFAYIVQPIVTPVPAFAKAAFRGADDVDFDSATEYTYTYTDDE